MLYFNWKFPPFGQHYPETPLRSPGSHPLTFCFPEFDILASTYKWDHVLFLFSCLASFALHGFLFLFHPCCHRWQIQWCFILCMYVYACVTFHVVCIYLSMGGHLECFLSGPWWRSVRGRTFRCFPSWPWWRSVHAMTFRMLTVWTMMTNVAVKIGVPIPLQKPVFNSFLTCSCTHSRIVSHTSFWETSVLVSIMTGN